MGKHGPPQQPSDHPRYAFMRRHTDLLLARGKASKHECVDCGRQALDWSQTHGTDGTNLHEHFRPRCRSCHKKYDYTDDQRQKISQALTGKPKSAKHRRNLSTARYLEELI